MEVVAAVALFAFLCWLAVRVGARWYAARPWTLESAKLGRKFGGLMRFGKSGAYLSLVKLSSKDRVTFTKRVRDAGTFVELDVSSPTLSAESVQRICSALSVLEGRVRWHVSEPWAKGEHLQIRLQGMNEHDSATLESVLRLATRELGHSDGDRYTVDFEGPADQDKVSAYYGWRR